MAISRMQMDRQLYAGGGILSLTPRSKFGLGSKLKKFVRNIIPNEVSEIAVKAAPFVAPFNPLLAGAMAGIGSFDQTGSISKGLKSGLLNYGGGQLARYVGGAGFQQGINPFAGADFSGGFLSGIQSLGSSPIGTTSGLKLGQYEMFGGTPTQQVVSSGQQPQLISDTAFDLSTLEPSVVKSTGDVVTQTTTPKYTDLFKQVLSGDAQQKTQALKQLGGKALKDIYTKPVPGSPGETQIDKLAIGATIAGATSYLEAKKLAEEAGIVDEGSEYTEEMYDADKARYSNYYSQILTPAAFGLKDGGRIGFAYGTPRQESGIPSITLTKQDNTEVAGLSNNRVAQLMSLLDDPTIDEDYRKQIQDEIRLLMSKKDGGRIGYKDGPTKEGIVSINPMQDDLEELLGPGAGIMAPGLAKIMSKGVPTFTSAEKTLVIRNLAGRGKGTAAYKELGVTIPEAKAIMDNPAANLKDATILKEFIKALMGKKDGGRMGFMMGSEVPIRQNQAGVNEMDYRNTGGFVPPIGVKERADDIPAMLSNNEFVFTADAVRAAGGGSVNKGAQKMYALMKQLEGKVV